jgi:hypothetical protein
MSDRKRPRSGDAPERKKSSLTPVNQDDQEDQEGMDFEDAFEDEIEEDDIITEEEAMALEEEDEEEEEKVKVWRPNVDQLAPDEVLEYDSNAYELYHVLGSDWPCLSLDIIQDKLGHQRTKVYLPFPYACLLLIAYDHVVSPYSVLCCWYASVRSQTEQDLRV